MTSRFNIRRLLVLCFVLFASLGVAPWARAYPCFYETAGPVQRGTGQNLMAGAIDTATGAYVKVFKCQSIPGVIPMAGWIYYDTQDASIGPFGRGTSTNYDYFVRATALYPGATYELIAPGNLHYAFDTNAGGTYSDSHDPELLGATLSFTNQPAGVTSTLTWKGGIRYQFDSFGGLIHIIDVPGNTVNITRNQINGFPAMVSSPTNTNRMVQFRQDTGNNHVTQILVQYSYLGSVRRWNIAYDVASNTGKMTSVTDPMSHVYAFTWTSYTRSDGVVLPLLATGTDGRNMTCLSLHYDASGRVISQDNATGGAVTYSYSAAIGTNGTATGTDPAGSGTTYTFVWNPNHYGYLLNQTKDNTLNETTTIAHTAAPTYLPTTITDYRGRVKSFSWNAANGDLLSTSATIASGGMATTTYARDPVFHKLTSTTDPAGRVSTLAVNGATGNVDSYTNPANETTTYGHTTTGLLASVTDPLGHTTSWGYDAYGLPTSLTQPAGGVASVTRDDLGEITIVTDEVGNSTYYTYDLLGRVASISTYPYPNAPANTILTNTYTLDAVGNMLSATDPAGHAWSWTYDCANEPLTETNPLGQTRRWTWTPMRQLATYTDFAGNTVSGGYLTDGRVSGLTFKNPGGGVDSTITYNYDPTTHLLANKVDSVSGTYSFATDLIDRITSYGTPNGSVGYQYDVLGRPTSMTPTGQNAITYTYHARGNVASVTQDAATTSLTCNAVGQPVTKVLPNGVTTTFARDVNGRVTTVGSAKNGVTFDNSNYTYDASGRITQIVATSGSSHTLTYNNYNQLTSVTDQNNPANTYTWSYNPNGTRATETVNGITTSYGYNLANQLTTVGANSLTLNPNGNPVAYNGRTYTWNSRNQLTGYVAPGTTANYVYAPTGAPVSSTVNGTASTYLGSGNSLLRQVVAGTPVNYLPGPGGVLKAGTNFVSANGNRSTTALTDNTGAVVGNYGYGAFGLATHTGTAATPLQFGGGLSDTPTLVHFGRTPYSPDLGRPLTNLGIAPTGPPIPGTSPNSAPPNVHIYSEVPDEEGAEYGAGGGGGGYTGSYTGAPNYAPGCGPALNRGTVDNRPLSAAGPNLGTLNGSVATTIRLGLAKTVYGAEGTVCEPELCRTPLDAATSSYHYPFNNLSTESVPTIGPSRVLWAMGKADLIEMDIGGMDLPEAYAQKEAWADGGYTNTEFQLCHSVRPSAGVRWLCNGDPVLDPRMTDAGAAGTAGTGECHIKWTVGLFRPWGG
jgi:YD repeat-containing protein